MKIKIEYLFLIIALIWGSIQLFILPPFQVPDEHGHFYRSWGIADYQPLCNNELETTIPVSAMRLAEKVNIHRTGSGLFSTETLKRISGDEIGSQKQAVYTQFCSYNPAGYLPQAAGISFAKLFNSSPLTAFYLGRIMNLLASIALVFLAIRIAPFGKTIFFFTGLLPMTIHQFASFSSDALSISALILFTSIILYYSQKKQLSDKELGIIGLSTLLIHMKPGYITFLALIFLLKPSQLTGKLAGIKKYLLFITLTVLLNVLMLFSLSKLADPDKYLKPPNSNVAPYEQLEYISENPLKVTGLYLSEVSDNTWKYTEDMIGVFGWYTVPLPEIFHIFILLALLLILISSREKIALDLAQRAVLFFTFWLTIFAIFTLEYMFWNDVGKDTLNGIQGRYFIAAFPLLIFSIYKFRLKNRINRTIYLSLVFVIIVVVSTACIYSHFYTAPKYLSLEPDKEAVNEYSKAIKETKSLKENQGGYTMEDKDASIIIDADKTEGLSFDLTHRADISFSYVAKDGATLNQDEVITEFPLINIRLLEDQLGKEVQEVKIKIDSPVKNNELNNIRVY